MVHSTLAALGVAALVAASPVLFEVLRWFGVGYLIYLAIHLIRSALKTGQLCLPLKMEKYQFRRGFLTALLNPKGMMIYVAVLPQFMDHGGSIGLQALTLSAIFIALCAVVYTILSIVIAVAGKKGSFSDRRRRWVEGISGSLLMIAAGRLAAN